MRSAVAEAAPAAGPRNRGRVASLGRSVLRQAEAVAFWLMVGPLLSLLPSSVAYRAAVWRSDLALRSWPEKRDEIVSNLREVLGEKLSEQEAERMAQEVFRMRTCLVIDLMLTRGRARGLGKLVEIRGREHLDAALAAGKGAILCSPHLGSYICSYSLINAIGYPVTSIGRWWWHYPPGPLSLGGRVWDFAYARRVLRQRHRPNIEPWPGRIQVAVQSANVLERNEVLTINSDPPPVGPDKSRGLEVPFLGGKVRLLAGVVTLAEMTGAPILMSSIRRLPDYRHQVLEISPPVPLEGGTAEAFERCVAAMEAAIMGSLAEWDFWYKRFDLVDIGLLSDAPEPAASVPG